MEKSEKDLTRRAHEVKILLLDCDGVLTDGRIIILPDGDETKSFDVRDGHAMVMAGRAGLKIGIISGRKSSAVRARARELGVSYLFESAWNKLEPYEEILETEKVTDAEICFVGDDVVDIPIFRRVGLAVAVADGAEEARRQAHFVTRNPGGRGAVREVIEMILKSQSRWDGLMSRYLV